MSDQPLTHWNTYTIQEEGQVGYRAVAHRTDVSVTLRGYEDHYRYMVGTLDHPGVVSAIGYTWTLARWNLERKFRERFGAGTKFIVDGRPL